MEKIAIIRRNGLGDLLCAIPLYRCLQKLYPHAHITFFVDERNAPLFHYFPEKIDRVIFPKGNKYFNLFQTALKHRKRKFDLAISAKTSPMKLINFFLFFLGAKKRMAVVDQKWNSYLINQPAKSKSGIHQALKSLQMIDPLLEKIPDEFYPTLEVPLEVQQKYLSQVRLNSPLVLLSASSTKAANRLNEESYASYVNQIHLEQSFEVILIGEEKDSLRAMNISKHLKMPHQVFFPKSFEEFMVLLNFAQLFFVSDGGIAHIGAALKKKQVIFFGGSSPDEWKPLSHECETLYHPENVNFIDKEEMLKALRSIVKELDGREHLHSQVG